MILVTGAAGKTGRAVIQSLVTHGRPVRGLVHRREQVDTLHALGVKDVVVGDLQEREDISRALVDVQSIYHICPNMHPNELLIGATAIQEAKSAGVQQFVYHSVLHPQIEAMPHHWQKMRVEEQIISSGLAFTILQPAAYMQNVLARWDQVVNQGIYAVPYTLETRISMVDLADVAEVAVRVLTEAGHDGATYALSSADWMTQSEMIAVMGQKLGRKVSGEVVALAEWKEQARTAGLKDYAVNTLVAMFQYYEQHGLRGNSRMLVWLLGREPTRFAEFIQRIISADA